MPIVHRSLTVEHLIAVLAIKELVANVGVSLLSVTQQINYYEREYAIQVYLSAIWSTLQLDNGSYT